MTRKGKHGFTLMELLMVMAVIGILAALMLPALSASKTAARRKRAQVECSQIEGVLRSYYADNRGWLALAGKTETSKAVVDIMKGSGGKIPYMEFSGKSLNSSGEMVDPWGNLYKIALCANNEVLVYGGTQLFRTCAVWSAGPDGKFDGTDGTDDVMSWK